MLLSTVVLSKLDYVNSILTRASITMTKPYPKIQNFAARVAYKKSKKRRCLHMPKRITLAAHKIQKHIQTAHNCIQYSSWKWSTIP